jgi:hypothetical protein
MKWGQLTPQARVRVGTVAILVIGFATAVVIYLIAQPPPGNPLGYDPLDTKKYLHDLEVYGGKANVLAAEFREWFDSLWHGERLAFTVAVITVIAACAFKFFATPLPSDPEASGANGGNPNGAADSEETRRNVARLTPRPPARRTRPGGTRPPWQR